MFDKEKALQALLYIASRAPRPDYIHLLKILYFAEKDHLAQYGRFICADDYKRLQWGPVPTRVYDLLKDIEGRGQGYFPENNRDYANRVKQCFRTEKHDDEVFFRPLVDADLSYLSKSDLKCLDAALVEYGPQSFADLTNASHDAVWSLSKEWNITLEEIVSTLPNREALLEYIRETS